MKRNLLSSALGILLFSGSVFAEGPAIGEQCAQNQQCVAQALGDFYGQVAPLAVTDTVTLTDVGVNGGIATYSLLLQQTRDELIHKPQDDFDLKAKMQDYAKSLSCADDKGLEQLYLETNGRLLWKVYFGDGEFYTNYFISECGR